MTTVLPLEGTLPITHEIWLSLGWAKGVPVELSAGPKGTLVARPQKSLSIEETAGILPKPARTVTLVEMQEAISSSTEG